MKLEVHAQRIRQILEDSDRASAPAHPFSETTSSPLGTDPFNLEAPRSLDAMTQSLGRKVIELVLVVPHIPELRRMHKKAIR